ncbi:CDP-glycerol--glycerophosphate glycerophosphotransferase [Flavobacterium sp. ABG]|uniref:CDP-glycerol--glycerophosphate glycerophosphotransferase n=1 Tax=Flavobacterium sp. ABG TaxID=1423322 RepID=UPI0006495972|nr:CDP-glycerol--glycerophosphate glycerophosphotransferase [Flavobacterium sp. ABG]KLT70165.1 CDP-glycerol:glycerophosphate glycerophosphotransferase [Flavobacterium sp. ABG]
MAQLKLFIKKFVPEILWISLIRIYNFTKLRAAFDWYEIKQAPKKHRKALQLVRGKEKVKVAFFLTHESVWKYDVLFDLMLKHPKFEPFLFVCPVVDYGVENMLFEMDKTFRAFKNKGYDVIKTYDNEAKKYLDIKKSFEPDLVFYTNPYEGLQDYRYYIKQFSRTLTCYVPYAVMTVDFEFVYNLNFHNLVWKIFAETPLHKEIALQKQRNKGRNTIVTGYPGFDPLLINKNPNHTVWKNKNLALKKIIWAPHHSMTELNRVANFLEYHDFFLELAEKYKDKVQIAFKPHHLLRVKLEQDVNWGKEKTDNYYNKWSSLENGQFDNGDYIALFLTSDALIHDCGSFMGEYLITGKPSLFMVREESVMEYWNVFGEKAVAAHYQSRNKKQVVDFIEKVVLNEKDWMKEERDNFVQNILIPKNRKTASENILEYLERQIFS